MKKATKAALISTLIYPGAGHLYLRKWTVGLVLAVIASWGLFIVLRNIITRAMELSDKIISGQVPPDIAVISQLIRQPQSIEIAQQLTTAISVLIIVWIIGILDSYRLGKRVDSHLLK